jgi:photosystem II stability/assembly factor-like uncharacterized protein
VTRSSDQGRTFAPVGSGPPLVLLSWPDNGPLVGVDAVGTLFASNDSGATWQARQALGDRPQALLAAGEGLVFVATEKGIHRSTDDGAKFETAYAFAA